MTATTPTTQALYADVAFLAAIERLPCSAGEREAALWIAARLRESGARTVIDAELVHGTYYWPMGLLNLLAAAGGAAVLAGRRPGALAGALAAAGIWQDLSGGRHRTTRRLLRRRPTTNVVAEIGPADAPQTLVIHAHHDATRTSFIFDQALPRLLHRLFPEQLQRLDRWPPLMGLVIGGPCVVALAGATGRRRATLVGTLLATGAAAVMAHMAGRPAVPGANDNLTGVAVLLEVARRLRDTPAPEGLRMILLSAGAEEANQEGMLAFGRRHLGALSPATTTFLCLDTLGSPELVLIEGEGFLKMYDYPQAMKDRVAVAAAEAGVHVRRGLRFTFATDGLVPLRRGYAVAALGSVNDYLVPSNYHWPTDTADNVDYTSVAAAADLVMATIARSGDGPPR